MLAQSTEAVRQEATINEIRTERLSRALRGMNKKSSPNLFPRPPRDRNYTTRAFVWDNEIEARNEREGAIATRRSSLSRTRSVSTVDEVRRHSGSSLSRRTQFQSLRIPNSNLERLPPLLAIGCNTLDRFVRHLMPRGVEGQEEDRNRNRSRATTVSNSVQLKIPKSPLPTPRIRSETEPGAKKESKPARINQSIRSKSSSTTSSRSLSPMMAFAGGMLGSISSDSQLSPGSPLSPGYGESIVLVVGSKRVGKTALINRFLQSQKKASYFIDSFMDDNRVNVIVEGEETQLRFIEVNNQESDLWLSLSCVAYVVVYHVDDTCSFRNAVDAVARLRERNDTKSKPILLVSNKQAADRKRFVIANDDGRQVARQNNCKFYEIYVSAGRSVADLLTGVVLEIRHNCLQRQEEHKEEGNSPRATFDHKAANAYHARTSSGGSTVSSTSSRNSSRTSLSLKLWSKRKVKRTTTHSPEMIILPTASLASGLQNCLFGERRGSRSLESLALFVKY